MPVVDDHAAQRGGAPAHIFGARHHFHIDAQCLPVELRERDHRRVGHQRHPAAVRHRGQCTHIGHFQLRIGEDFEEETGRVLIEDRFELFGTREVAKAHFDPKARQGFGEQRIGIAEKMARGDHIGASRSERKEGGADGRHARIEGNDAARPGDGGHAVFEVGDGGIGHARIVGSRDAFAKDIGHGRRIFEFIRHTFIDRHTQGVVSITARIGAVNGTGVFFHVSCFVLMCRGQRWVGQNGEPHALSPYAPRQKYKFSTRGGV